MNVAVVQIRKASAVNGFRDVNLAGNQPAVAPTAFAGSAMRRNANAVFFERRENGVLNGSFHNLFFASVNIC